ncbi:MAG: hypothetical protein HQL29_03860 [Candidatus Omnitrophica bacterium]|nr:hypothetical protein [Candidatus Omnitrophota bacterium]
MLKKSNCFVLMFLFVSVFLFYGCAEFDVPTPGKILNNPMGSSIVKIGMTKNEVNSLYGTPDLKRTVYSTDWEAPREEWYYKANMNILPISAGYLTDDVYLYFDSNSLTNISDAPIGTYEENDDK